MRIIAAVQVCFFSKKRSLPYTESVLLVYDCQAEVTEDDIVLDQCVCSYYDSYAAVFQACMYFTPFGCLRAAGQEG